MPELSRFYGIVIKMFFADHTPPHFHAQYEEQEALIDINRLSIISGKLSPRALGLVMEWASIHQAELKIEWEKATTLQPLGKIAPLN
jgi:hypothetical protein